VSTFIRKQEEAGITDDEILLTCDNVLNGAAETIRQTISSGLLALLDNPRQLHYMWHGEVNFEWAAEEMLRWAVPVHHLLRTAKSDTVLMDTEIKTGQPVSVWIPSMNRDERIFDRATEFIIGREPKRNLTFGAGRHFCIGAPLARLTIRVLLEELVNNTSEIALNGTPGMIPSHVIGGVCTLPISIRPR
jgi:cytochrome P450